MELGQLPDDQLGVRPVQAVRLVLARRVREALWSEMVICRFCAGLDLSNLKKEASLNTGTP